MKSGIREARFLSLQFDRKAIMLMFLFAFSFLLLEPKCSGEIKQNLSDEKLQKECDWAMYLDVQDMQKILNEKSSKLRPLSRVRISFRAFPLINSSSMKRDSDSRTYEELWYHYRTPVGSRRYMEPQLADESLGIIVLGPSDGKNKHSEQLTNALIRLLIDLQFKKATTSIVMVPENNFDEIAACLNYYNFWSDYKLSSGKRMNIHLSSSSSAREEYFYLGK